MVIMTLLGLAFVLAGQTESRIAVNQRNGQQALQVAESGVRMVKKWFDVPTGTTSYLVPTTSQMDRNQRWVDDNNDGVYGLYSTAAAPYDVIYRSTTNDPFEKPYRGSPALAFMGTEAHPDITISESGGSGETTYLATLNSTLFSNFPSPGQQGRIARIDVYSPPIISIGGVLTRYGIATIKVTAGVYEFVGTASERRIATRVVKAVINEAPYTGPGGPLQSGTGINMNGNFAPHWGKVTAKTIIDLPNGNLDGKVDSSIPWVDRNTMITRDLNNDGTIVGSTVSPFSGDDQDHDGIVDFDNWVTSADVDDPWLRFWAEGSFVNHNCAVAGLNCQPEPWFSSGSLHGGSNDHSNMIANVDTPTFPEFNYQLWKSVAQAGSQNTFYYASDGAGSGTYKLNGSGTSVSMRTATEGNTGLFFFDTATNTAPVDADSNGTYDNLSDAITINGGGYSTTGFVYLNADFRTTGNGSPPNRTIYAPSEPYIDANGNGVYDSTEWFIDLTYPAGITGHYAKSGLHRAADGFTRQVPASDVSTAGHYSVGLALYGVLYTNGGYNAQGNWIYYGSVCTKQGMDGVGAGTPDLYFDERLVTGAWPPVEMGLPRTIITAWETDL